MRERGNKIEKGEKTVTRTVQRKNTHKKELPKRGERIKCEENKHIIIIMGSRGSNRMRSSPDLQFYLLSFQLYGLDLEINS